MRLGSDVVMISVTRATEKDLNPSCSVEKSVMTALKVLFVVCVFSESLWWMKNSMAR